MNTNKIASYAHSSKKLSKKLCFEQLKELITTLDDDNDTHTQNLSYLYSYFLPAIGKAKTPEQWVQKAVGAKDVRYYINQLYSDGTYLNGTDGHRVHRIKTDLAEGFYNSDLERLNDFDAKYPNIDQVIPKGLTYSLDNIDLTKFEVFDFKGIDVYQIPDSDTRINCTYLKQALQGFDNPVIYFGNHSLDSVLIKERDHNDLYRLAVVMPVKYRPDTVQ